MVSLFFFFMLWTEILNQVTHRKKMVTFSAFILLSISFSLACALSVLLSLSLSLSHTHTHTHTHSHSSCVMSEWLCSCKRWVFLLLLCQCLGWGSLTVSICSWPEEENPNTRTHIYSPFWNTSTYTQMHRKEHAQNNYLSRDSTQSSWMPGDSRTRTNHPNRFTGKSSPFLMLRPRCPTILPSNTESA